MIFSTQDIESGRRVRFGELLAAALSILALAACDPEPPRRARGGEISVRFEVVENLESSFRARLTLTNEGVAALPGHGWRLYFNFLPAIDAASLPPEIGVAHVNGDLWLLEPRAGFRPIAPGAERSIPFGGDGRVAKVSEAPAGYYFAWPEEGDLAERVASSTVEPIPLPPDVVVPTAAERHRAYRRLTPPDVAELVPLVPTPLDWQLGSGRLTIDPEWRIVHHSDLADEAAYLAEALGALLGTPLGVEATESPAGDAPPKVAADRSATDNSLAPEAGAPEAGDSAERMGEARAAEGAADKSLAPEAAEATAPRLGAAAADNPLAPRHDPRRILLEIADGPGAAPGEARGREKLGPEAYRLEIGPAIGVQIVGGDAAGVFYGIQSLRALVSAPSGPAETLDLPVISITDAPRFAYRGLHLDVARNFQPPEAVAKLLELASFYKLNRFHFHLSDDEGWRLAVPGLPELTEVGGRRGHVPTEAPPWLPPSFGSGPEPGRPPGSGHYTRPEMVELVRQAHRRHIRVVPEIDLPGHARAAVRSMEVRHERLAAAGRTTEGEEHRLRHPQDVSTYRSVQGWDDNVVDVCLPATYRFIERVVDELVAIWAEAGAPLEAVHVGGDEVPEGTWEGSPACRQLIAEAPELDSTADLPAYFIRRVAGILAERDLATAGWEEIALDVEAAATGAVRRPAIDRLDLDLRPYVWNNIWGWGSEDTGYRLANAGFPVVLANATNLYFDLAYSHHPAEPGYTWAGTVDTRRAWEMVPFDIYRGAEVDRRGRPLDPTAFAGKERLTESGRRQVLGIQGQIWGENASSPERMEYLAFPKLLGLAERAWAGDPAWARTGDRDERQRRREAAWNEFAHRLGQRELPRLDRWGVAYRLPPPGAAIIGGRLEASAAFPGLAVRFTTDGSEPTAVSALYTRPVEVDSRVRLATFDTRGRASQVVEVE